MATVTARTVASVKTALPPCAVLIHPKDDSLAVVGTYKLDEESRTRHGSIDLFDVGAQLTLVHSQPTENSSVLDLKLNPGDSSILASSQSTGSIILWKLDIESRTLSKIKEYQLFDESTLVLSMAFANDSLMSATLTTGEVALLKITESTLELVGTSQCHMDQCWISEFGNRSLSNILWSGADDCSLIAHDTRTFGDGTTIWKRMLHDAGVTSILPSSDGGVTGNGSWMPDSPFALWTGGYDDNLRSIDLRTTDTLESYHIPIVKNSIDIGGGVWRLVPSPVENDNRVLACCMYGGARVLNPSEPADVLCSYTNHESMVYGGGWRHDGKSVLTCSFYDNQLRLWSTI